MAGNASIYELKPTPPGEGRWWAERPHLPYLLPLLAFGLIMAPGGMLGNFAGIDWKGIWKAYHPFIYFAKTAVAAGMLWWFWRYYTPIRWTHLMLGVLVGLAGVPLWVGLEYLSQRVGWGVAPSFAEMYNPDVEIGDPIWRVVFLVIRVAGPTLVVPLMEELFYRDFLMRAFIGGSRFEDVEVGAFSWLSLLGTAGVFTLSHIQKPSALVWALMMGVLMVRTKSLGACIVAHGVTNFVLYLYVIYRGDWQFM